MSPEIVVTLLIFSLDRLDGDSVKLSDLGRVPQEILQNVLVISWIVLKILDYARLTSNDLLSHIEDEFVAPRHRVEQGIQCQVFGERLSFHGKGVVSRNPGRDIGDALS